jgi:hypothetical protein
MTTTVPAVAPQTHAVPSDPTDTPAHKGTNIPQPDNAHDHRGYIAEAQAEAEIDPVEDVVKVIPIALPMVGAVLMFLLAFIAISMA